MTMAKVLRSLHIGVDRVDPVHYEYKGSLVGCENDARAMELLARSRGFTTVHLIGPQAKADAVRAAITDAAKAIGSDGLFFLSISAHCGQAPSTEVPPEIGEGDDEICALYDRMLIDDELAELWTSFAENTRVLVVADLCHSGSIQKVFIESVLTDVVREIPALALAGGVRALPPDVPVRTFYRHEGLYTDIQQRAAEVRKKGTVASILTLSACQDDEEAKDGSNGLFTSKVLEVCSESPTISYSTLHGKVAARVTGANSSQHPKITVDPKTNTTFAGSAIFV
jgi:hypothetical protein